MSTNRLPIDSFLPLSKGHLLLDVRSPGEYDHAHIPGAVSLPLFSNEERAVVGTTYKQQSREQAIKVGLDYFGPKMRPMVERVEELLQSHAPDREVYVYCWRGGMRSGAVAWLLDLYGFRVSVLGGGYKAYRNLMLDTLAQPYALRVVGGYTGSGKTELLQELARQGAAVIDLEGLACHKGSAFGALGMPAQPSQEMFDNLLGEELLRIGLGREIWVEDESQRIGLVNIHPEFWTTMRAAPVYFLDIPFEERLSHIMKGYGGADTVFLSEAIQRISRRLGGLETKNALAYLQAGELRSCFAILLKYYDKKYHKGLTNRREGGSVVHTVPCARVHPENANLLTPNPTTA